MKEDLENIAKRKEKIQPIVREEMQKMLGLDIKEICEDISNKLVEGNIDFDIDISIPFKKAKELFKKAYLTNILAHTNGNISEAARIAGIDRRSIHRLIEKFKIIIENMRDLPYKFLDEKQEQYVRRAVEDTLEHYELTKDRARQMDVETAKGIAQKIPHVRLTFDEAIDLFEKEYVQEAIKKFGTSKKAAKAVGIRYETMHKKVKESSL